MLHSLQYIFRSATPLAFRELKDKAGDGCYIAAAMYGATFILCVGYNFMTPDKKTA